MTLIPRLTDTDLIFAEESAGSSTEFFAALGNAGAPDDGMDADIAELVGRIEPERIQVLQMDADLGGADFHSGEQEAAHVSPLFTAVNLVVGAHAIATQEFAGALGPEPPPSPPPTGGGGGGGGGDVGDVGGGGGGGPCLGDADPRTLLPLCP